MPYSIIIPIHNEEKHLHSLLNSLKEYSPNNEILIVDDGSTDNSSKIIRDHSFIKVIKLNQNSGKGTAVRKGLEQAYNDKIIILDGDMEINPNEITSLMKLDKKKGVNCIFGSRFEKINPFSSLWDFGNFIFTLIFNILIGGKNKDVLCCFKSFFRSDLNIEQLCSQKFDIDVELTAKLVKKHDNISTVKVSYKRRNKKQGKKLKFIDGWYILKRILVHII